MAPLVALLAHGCPTVWNFYENSPTQRNKTGKSTEIPAESPDCPDQNTKAGPYVHRNSFLLERIPVPNTNTNTHKHFTRSTTCLAGPSKLS